MPTYRNLSGQVYQIGPHEIGYVRTKSDGKFYEVSGAGGSPKELTDQGYGSQYWRLANKQDEYADVDDLNQFLNEGGIVSSPRYDPAAIRDYERQKEYGMDPSQEYEPPPKMAPQARPQTRIITTPDGVRHKVQVGSKAEAKYEAQLNGQAYEPEEQNARSSSRGGSSRASGDTGQDTGQMATGPQQPVYQGFPASNLQPGQRGPEVQALQSWLMAQGFSIPSGATGFYGNETKAAVTALQRSLGVDTAGNDGYYGPRTRSALQGGSQSPVEVKKQAARQMEEGEVKREEPDRLAPYGYSLAPEAEQSFKMAPAKSFSEIYNGVFDSLGLKEVKKNIDDTLKKVNALDQQLADEISDINENPWLTDGVRRSQIQKLQERFDLKRAPHASNLTLYEDIYNNGRSEARYVAEQTLNQYNQEREFQLDEIDRWVDAAEKLAEAEEKARGSSADFKSVQGGLYNIRTGEWVVPPAPKSVGGGLYDTQEEEFIVPPTPKNTPTTGTSYETLGQELRSKVGPDGYTDPYEYLRLREKAKSASEFDKRFAYLVNPLSREMVGLKTATDKSTVKNPFQ